MAMQYKPVKTNKNHLTFNEWLKSAGLYGVNDTITIKLSANLWWLGTNPEEYLALSKKIVRDHTGGLNFKG
jgi:hypothetical protein